MCLTEGPQFEPGSAHLFVQVVILFEVLFADVINVPCGVMV